MEQQLAQRHLGRRDRVAWILRDRGIVAIVRKPESLGATAGQDGSLQIGFGPLRRRRRIAAAAASPSISTASNRTRLRIGGKVIMISLRHGVAKSWAVTSSRGEGQLRPGNQGPLGP